jgi:hypothetical protein
MDFAPSVRDAMFSSSDPMPAIFEVAQLMKFFSEYSLKALWKRAPNLSRQAAPQKSKCLPDH